MKEMRVRPLTVLAVAGVLPIFAFTAQASERAQTTATSSSVASTSPQLTVSPMIGAAQTTAGSCSVWTPAACAAAAPTLSPDGTTGTCSEFDYLSCCTTQAASCTNLLETLFNQTYNANLASAGTTFVMPGTMPVSANTAVQGLAFASAPFLAATTGTGSTALGREMQLFTQAPYVPTTMGSVASQLVAAENAYNTAWNNPRYTGQQIGSCDEYVWKKWQGLARWEDAARAGANNPLYVAINAFSALGATPPTRADGQPLSVNGTPWVYQYETGQVLPHNPFFNFIAEDWLAQNDPTQAAIAQALDNVWSEASALGTASEGGSATASATNELQWASACTSLTDPGCTTVGVAGPWSPGMSVPNQVIAAEVYASQDARVDAYAELLSQWAALDYQIELIDSQIAALEPPPPAPVVHHNGSGGTPESVREVPAAGSASESTVAPPRFVPSEHPNPIERRAAAMAYLAARPRNAAARAQAVKATTTSSNSAQLQALEQQAAALGALAGAVAQQMVQMLVAEWALPNQGCLRGPTAGPGGSPAQYMNSCDWSPTSVIAYYVGLFGAQREAAYQRCVNDTGNKFPIPTGAASGFLEPALQEIPSFTVNLATFEQYLANYENRDTINQQYEIWLAQDEKTMLMDTTSLPVTGNGCSSAGHGGAPNCSPTFGESGGDSHQIGGSYFGALVRYGAQWSAQATLAPVSPTMIAGAQQINGLYGDVNASLFGQITVFGQNVTVVDAALDVSADPPQTTPTALPPRAAVNKAHVITILGDDLWQGPEGDTWTSGQTPPTVSTAFSDTPLDPGFTTIIPVMGIPVKISADVAFTVGVTASASVSPPPLTPSPSNVSVSASANVTPSANITAKIEAGVDLFVISVGVGGQLTLIDASLPTTATLAPTVNASGELSLQSTFTSQLDLTFMSGGIYLWGEVDAIVWSDKVTIPLGSWKGFSPPPFNLFPPRDSTWPIASINYRLFGQVPPND